MGKFHANIKKYNKIKQQCHCGKRIWTNRFRAMNFLIKEKKDKNYNLYVYKCKLCNGFHITSKDYKGSLFKLDKGRQKEDI